MDQAPLQRQEQYRSIPSVDELLRTPEIAQLSAEYGRENTVSALRNLLSDVRTQIRISGGTPAEDSWFERVRHVLALTAKPSLLPVINATGVIIHTNLGRAPLSASARQAVSEASLAYSNLEYSLEDGQRGSRHDHARERLISITGAEDAMVVNNNAAAIYLTLLALCSERDVAVSRGQLVEIGGGFRIPDVLRQSGARLVEVGTTNRTHVRDFADALSPDTAAIMRIHSSNFKQIGFVTEPSLGELVRIAGEYNSMQGHAVLVIDDLGSGTLLDTSEYGLAPEPMVQSSLAAGADIVTFSGDKLLGGPQAGIILGRSELIARLRRHPIARALRVDKMTLAALEATLRSYQQGRALQEIPVWRMISAGKDALKLRVEAWICELSEQVGNKCDMAIWKGESAVGGGSLPGETLPTYLLAIQCANASRIASDLRLAGTPVVCRIQQDRLVFDPRTVMPEQDGVLMTKLSAVLSKAAPDDVQ